MDARIKACGAQNAYFPLFIRVLHAPARPSTSRLQPRARRRDARGGKQLEEPIIVRPTSETVIGEFMASGCRATGPAVAAQPVGQRRGGGSFVRASSCAPVSSCGRRATPRTPITTTRATTPGASCTRAYEDLMVNVLAVPVLVGRKTKQERFAGRSTQ